ncbi:MAG: hypothetical protein ABIY63_18165 [Fibrobacteria bacterium]
MEWENAKPIWAKESRSFARKSKGEVHVFQTARGKANPESIWKSHELPMLEEMQKQGKIDNIIYQFVPDS